MTVRRHAIEQIGLAAQASSEAVLADLLRDGAVAEASVVALGRVLGGDRTRVSLHALGSPHVAISANAARFLAGAGDAATLVDRLGSVTDADVRRMLREGIVRRGELPIAQLDAALRGDDPRPRTEAAWIAGYGGEAAKPLGAAIVAAVARGDASWHAAPSEQRADEANAWQAAMWAAERVGAQAPAQAALGDDRAPASVRRVAARSADASMLATRIGDVDRDVRAVAAATVAASQPQRARELVAGLGARTDATTIQPLAAAGWAALAAPGIAEPGSRAWALALSLAIRSVAELIAIATSKADDATRIAAIGALGRLGDDSADAALEKLHADKAEPDAIRLAAWKALKRIARKPKAYGEGVDQGGAPGATTAASDEDDAEDGDAEDDDDGDGDADDEDDGDDDDDDDDDGDDDDDDDE